MPAPSVTPLVELTGVQVALGGDIVLRDIDWTLREGEHWLVSGANGAGKTTLLRVLRGDLPVIYGTGRRTYNLVGRDDDVGTAKRRIGYLSPEFHERLLRMELPLTVRELITGGLHGALYLAEAPTAAQRRRVAELAEALDLTKLLDEPMAELSFGQLRRTLLARALVATPRVLVLDEFAHGIDRHSRSLILTALGDCVEAGTALVVATHRREELPPAITHELHLKAGTISHAGALSKTLCAVSRAGSNGAVAQADGGAPLVSLRDVDVFIEHRRVLRGINWEIRRGERWLVSGRNGAGKSTLAKLLYGRLRAAYGGTVERYGSRQNLSVTELRQTVALISDDEQLRYDWSVPVETVVVSGYFASVGLMQTPTPEQKENARRLIDDFGLDRLRKRPFLELSFGERRLVLVARALVRTPRLLVLDEALNGFDPDARAKILRRLEELANAGTAIVLIGHHESDVPEWVDNELVLEEGRIVSATRP
ncbi:MAG: ABC transporter ATP-binding protein [Vulcanimicrobiaceae bacterium]